MCFSEEIRGERDGGVVPDLQELHATLLASTLRLGISQGEPAQSSLLGSPFQEAAGLRRLPGSDPEQASPMVQGAENTHSRRPPWRDSLERAGQASEDRDVLLRPMVGPEQFPLPSGQSDAVFENGFGFPLGTALPGERRS